MKNRTKVAVAILVGAAFAVGGPAVADEEQGRTPRNPIATGETRGTPQPGTEALNRRPTDKEVEKLLDLVATSETASNIARSGQFDVLKVGYQYQSATEAPDPNGSTEPTGTVAVIRLRSPLDFEGEWIMPTAVDRVEHPVIRANKVTTISVIHDYASDSIIEFMPLVGSGATATLVRTSSTPREHQER